MQPNGNLFKQAIGRIDNLRMYAERQNKKWCQGMQTSASMFST
ncbi:hypothetical protein MNBD_GAMMA21-3055 [hydrothermal vent metagenome]|uniref:Uncharacterized protein n=1 Tax=hydrothermal vent metagenome TaxID=652676 RepID=A0A3B0ZJS8_9ZZZZ